jgi:hypothetical protein
MKNPRSRPQGIDKNLAQQARVLRKLSDKGFEEAVTEARGTWRTAARANAPRASGRQRSRPTAKST